MMSQLGETRVAAAARVGVRRAIALFVVALLAAAGNAGAQSKYGPIVISGNMETQNILRVPEIDKWSFVQQRNTFRFEYEHNLLQKGKLFGLMNAPWLQNAKLFTYYRGVYDSIYDLGPGPRQEGQDARRDGSIEDFDRGERTEVAVENNIREAYVDFALSEYPVLFRIGKQQIVWGNANLNQRALDSVNALDLTWHFNIETGLLGRVGFSELRRTAWTAKMLVNLGDIGPLGNAFLEVYDIPFDFHQTKVRTLPAPWSAGFYNFERPGLVIRSPTGAVIQPCFDMTGWPGTTSPGTGPGQQDFSDTPETGRCNTNGLRASRLEQGIYDRRDPKDVNQVGGRIGALLPYSVGFTLNYMYRRSLVDVSGTTATRVPGAQFRAANTPLYITTSQAALGTPTHSSEDPVLRRQTDDYNVFLRIPIEYYMPYVHVFGATMDYFDETVTGGVINAEMAWTHNNPIRSENIAEDPSGVRRTDMMLGALSLDKPIWIRPINKGRTIGMQTQLNVGWQPFHDDGFVGSISGGNRSIPGLQLSKPVVDNLEEYTLLTAFVMNTEYMGGSLVPVFIWVSDWTVAPLMRWDFILQYLYTPQVILEGQFRTFWTNGKIAMDRFAQGQSRRRDELVLKATYQF